MWQRPETKTTSDQFLELKDKIINGDVLLSITFWELSNSLMPSKWKHCGVYHDGWVYESTTKNVRKVLLEEFFFKKDSIGLVRKTGKLGILDVQAGHSFLSENMDEPYDFGFGWVSAKSWYCSKYVYNYFCAADTDFSKQFVPIKVLGEPTVIPQDFWYAKEFSQILKFNTEGRL